MFVSASAAGAPQRLDARLNRRVCAMRQAAGATPTASFPNMFPNRKDLDGAYDLLSNARVTPGALVADHIQQTVRRCKEFGQILTIHDGSEFRFGGIREGLGPLGDGGRGFLGHFSVAISGEEDRQILGLLAMHLWTRSDESRKELLRTGKVSRTDVYMDPNKESVSWMDGIRASESALQGAAHSIHVMDSGADDFTQFNDMDELGLSYVLRAKHNRSLLDPNHDGQKLFEVVREAPPTEIRREVPVQARTAAGAPPKRKQTHPQRLGRIATLGVAVTSVSVKRPNRGRADFQKTVQVNLVRVFELDPGKDVEPIEWILATNLPVNSPVEIARVIDIYRARWVVEEYFKALKSGCAVQSRQLETGHALMNMTALFSPIAVTLLGLRDAARHTPDRPARDVLEDDVVTVLARVARVPVTHALTAAEAMNHIAKLGGHQKSNGQPGWAIMARGFQEILTMVRYHRILAGQ